MNRSKILLISIYLISITLISGITFSFNMANQHLENELPIKETLVSNPKLAEKFFQSIKSGNISSEEYIVIFKANFVAEKTRIDYTKGLIQINKATRDAILCSGLLQLLLLTLYVKYNQKT